MPPLSRHARTEEEEESKQKKVDMRETRVSTCTSGVCRGSVRKFCWHRSRKKCWTVSQRPWPRPVVLSTQARLYSAQRTRRRRCRYGADMEPIRHVQMGRAQAGVRACVWPRDYKFVQACVQTCPTFSYRGCGLYPWLVFRWLAFRLIWE